MDRLLCDMSWNCMESVAMYIGNCSLFTVHTHTVFSLHIVHMQNSSATVSIVLVWYNRNIDKWTNRTMAFGVRVSSCRENYSIKTNWCEHTHTHSQRIWCVLCGVCTVVHVAAGKSSAQNSLAYSLVIRVVKIDPVLNVTRTPKQTTTWPLPSIFFAYDNAQPFLWLLFICSLFYSLVCVFFLFLRCCCCYLLFFFSFVHAFMCTSIIVCSTLSLLLLLPLFPFHRYHIKPPLLLAVDVLKLLVFIVIVCFIHLRLKHSPTREFSALKSEQNQTTNKTVPFFLQQHFNWI